MNNYDTLSDTEIKARLYELQWHVCNGTCAMAD